MVFPGHADATRRPSVLTLFTRSDQSLFFFLEAPRVCELFKRVFLHIVFISHPFTFLPWTRTTWGLAPSQCTSIANLYTLVLRKESSTCITSWTLIPVCAGVVEVFFHACANRDLPDDVEALASGNKVLKQLIPAVVNLVYKKLLVYDITSRAFHTQTTADETEPEQDYLHEETPQIKRRKMFLRWYLIKLCQDPTSMDFWRYLNKVG